MSPEEALVGQLRAMGEPAVAEGLCERHELEEAVACAVAGRDRAARSFFLVLLAREGQAIWDGPA